MTDKSNEIFAEGTLKVLLGFIPIPGLSGIINEVMFDMPGRVRMIRLESLVQELKKNVGSLKEGYNEYVRTEDFYDLTNDVVTKAVSTKSKEKHQILSRLYIDFINDQIDFESEIQTIFLDYTKELKPIQFRLLVLINSIPKELNQIGSFENFYELLTTNYGLERIDKYEFKLHINKLESMTLLSTGRGLDDFDAIGGLMALESYEKSSVILTTLGNQYLSYLEGITWHNIG